VIDVHGFDLSSKEKIEARTYGDTAQKTAGVPLGETTEIQPMSQEKQPVPRRETAVWNASGSLTFTGIQ